MQIYLHFAVFLSIEQFWSFLFKKISFSVNYAGFAVFTVKFFNFNFLTLIQISKAIILRHILFLHNWSQSKREFPHFAEPHFAQVEINLFCYVLIKKKIYMNWIINFMGVLCAVFPVKNQFFSSKFEIIEKKNMATLITTYSQYYIRLSFLHDLCRVC